MISLSQFRSEIYALARLMIKTGMYVDFAYRGRVYRIHITDTGETVKQQRRSRKKPLVLETQKCPRCNKLQVAGVCMNSGCPAGL
jgi:hypothetical protein